MNSAYSTSGEAEKKERIRRQIVNVVFVIYWLLIFEGALRKWAFPSLQKALYFIRDPFVLYVYYLTIRYKMWPKWSPPFVFGLSVATFFIVLALLQILTNNINPLVSAIGLRGYFWYVPLTFIIGAHFKGKDLARLVRETLLIAVPISVLVYFQFRAGPGAWINKSLEEDATPFLLVKDIVRTTGTFTFSAGQVMFIASIAGMALTLWLLPRKDRPLNPLLCWVTTGSTLVCLYMAGSRSAFFSVAISLIAAFVSGLLMRDREQQMRSILLPGAISVIGAVFYVTVFSAAYEAMLERQALAQANEGSTFARAVRILTDVVDVLPRSTIIGYGIGVGSNAGAVLATGVRTFTLSENELPRIIDEAGFAGLLYIGFRFWLVGWLGYSAAVATRRANNPLPLMLFAFDGVTLMVGQITLQGTINGYGWLFAGFCIAANRLGENNKPQQIGRRRRRPIAA